MNDEENLKAESERHIPRDYDPDLYKIRHSVAHVMAQAVLERFPNTKIAIGPPVEQGFYYDFDLEETPSGQDLLEIETRMRKIIRGNHPFRVRSVRPEEARQLFKDQPFKLELIEGLVRGDADEYGHRTD